jgi:hypothetical protein
VDSEKKEAKSINSYFEKTGSNEERKIKTKG